MLHAKHISNYEYEGIVIVAQDTDVRLLAIAFSDHISIPIFQKCASQTCPIYINLTAVSHFIEYSLSKALLGLHGFTGCDTVSAFARKGKVSALNILKKHPGWCEIFQMIGEDWVVSDALMNRLVEFVCTLYDSAENVKGVNLYHYHLKLSERKY